MNKTYKYDDVQKRRQYSDHTSILIHWKYRLNKDLKMIMFIIFN